MEVKSNYRIASIDILRGIVMIIMALDHTRDFFHNTAMTADPLDPATTHPALYFTRWITHFCAPVFVFLSGLSAWLSSQKKSKTETSLFLIKRGLWLVLVEITLVTFGITFNPHFNFLVLQVIWVIGWSMVFLGILVRISQKLILIMGLILFFGHNIFDYVNLPQSGAGAIALQLLFRSNAVIALGDSHNMMVLYAILPWTAAMFLGFSIGSWFYRDFAAAKRKRVLLQTGLSLVGIFLLIRYFNLYGNPRDWQAGGGFWKSVFEFLNTSKYPPSLQYLCMTLGPACIFLSFTENIRTRLSRFVAVYGQVPFFYYILHFYLLHFILAIVFFASGYSPADINDPQLFFAIYFRPLNFGYNLWVVYVIWIAVVLILYFPCRWFSRYKKEHTAWWLRYV
jgi:uncharacterized membrane protein